MHERDTTAKGCCILGKGLHFRSAAMACCICNGEIETVGGWREGHNAQPVADGRCCGDCNATRVIPARLGLILGKGKG